MDETQQKFTFVYEKASGKPTLPVTGAFGGPTGDGRAVVVHVFVEHVTVPSIVTHSVDENRNINLSELDSIKRGDVTREIQASLVMSPEHALDLGRFLLEKGTIALQHRVPGISNQPPTTE